MEVVAEGGQVDGTSNERPVDGNTFPQPAQSGGAGEEVQEAQTRHYSTRKDIPATSTEWGAGEDNRQDKTLSEGENSVNTTFPQPAHSEEPERSFSTTQDKLNQPKGVHSYEAQVGLLLFFETPNERDDKNGTERAF